MTNYRRLPVKGLMNARDLGGFAVSGGVTKFGVFVRSDVPADLTQEDKLLLKKYGLKSVVDFRSSKECSAKPDVLSGEAWVSYINIPMYDEAAAKGICTSDKKFCWADHYIRMVESCRSWMREVITVLSKSESCVLFHCATGKDRTGLAAMALLGLCGVSDYDIAADYSVSGIYLQPLCEKLLKEGKINSLDDPFFSTSPENMLRLTAHINKEYGGICSYLESCGISKETLLSLKNRLVQKA